MAKLYNLARMSTATTGTGPITLGSAVSGFLSFVSAGIADGETVTYAIQDGAASEIGRGVYTAAGTTLTRSVLKSTNAGAAISLSGTAQVFITPAAEDFLTPVNAQTGTTYTVVSDDLGKLVTFSNASAIAVTLPQATGSFGAGWYATFSNIGAGAVTITPTTSTIAGAATLVLQQNQSVRVISTGANYVVARGLPFGHTLGTTTNDNAPAGYVGEYTESDIVSGSAVSLTTATAANVTSLSLSAGDWDVWGLVAFTASGGAAPTTLVAAIHTTSATLPASGVSNGGANMLYQMPFTSNTLQRLPAGRRRYSFASTTTIYLIAQASFTSGAMTAHGVLCARRAR